MKKGIKNNYTCRLCGLNIAFDNNNICSDCKTIIESYQEDVSNEFTADDIKNWLFKDFCSNCDHGHDNADDCTFNKFHCPAIFEELRW